MKTSARIGIINCMLCSLFCAAAATTNQMTRCTAGGMRISLSADTNIFTVKQAIFVTLTISNASESRGKIWWHAGAEYQPGFGKLLVTNATEWKVMDYCKEKSGRISARGSTFDPADSMEFRFNLSEDYGVTNIGTYYVGFAGQLGSMYKEDEQVKINVPCLELHVIKQP